MKEPALDENRLTATMDGGTLNIDQRQLLPGPPPVVSVTDPDGHVRTLPMNGVGPGHATLSMPAAEPGLWRVSDGTRTAYAASDMADPPEWADLRATATKAGAIIAATDGSAHWLLSGRCRRRGRLDRAATERRPCDDRNRADITAARLGSLAASAGRSAGRMAA
jgi:hypothetical protein